MSARIANLLLGAVLAIPGPVPAAPADHAIGSIAAPGVSRASVRFEAGTHTGRQFDAAGAILRAKTATLVRPSSASASARERVPGRGIQLRISTGLWAGFWIPESSVSYIRGIAGDTRYGEPTPVRFQPGMYLGYRFDAAWRLASTHRARVTRVSTARADRAAVINGRPYVHIANGTWAGTWIPGSAGAPLPIGCRAGNRPTDGAARVIRSAPGATGSIALTFDGGGRLDPARSILEFLVLERICATVFPTGAMAASSQGRTVLELVRDHPELFEVGNHTQHHCDLVRGGGAAACPAGAASSVFIASELRTAAAAIVTATGQSPIPFWRPPFGALDTRVSHAAAAAGYPKTIMWAVDTIDWRPLSQGGPTATAIASKVRSAAPGSIVLMHLGGYNTLDALPWALAGLRARGIVTTSVSDLVH